ncbi:30S ribosomal protein S16 [Candidatus Daviesbacteria bacterium RIFCSPLOWO2_01_FULL_40_27]|nr:MAG: 30S ribosomal protein S16 [Candidatus Daviesbacteria bacterium RIFCSPLOWO2_01_FULL_40_27]
MLKIRLMRIGAKKKPFYRVVVVDERAKRTGAYIELLGTYNPLTEPKDIKLKQDRIDYWVKQGAQLSHGFLRIIGKAPQRPPRKPKKEKKTESSAISDQTSEKTAQKEEPVEEVVGEETKEAKSESNEAISEVEHTTEANESSEEQGAKQTHSEPRGEASGASRPDEPTTIEENGEKDERPA